MTRANLRRVIRLPAAALVLVMLGSCGSGTEEPTITLEVSPSAGTVLLVLTGLEPSPALPWSLSGLAPRLAAGMLALSKDGQTDVAAGLVESAGEAGLLLALVDTELPGGIVGAGGREDMILETGPDGLPRSTPDVLQEEAGESWSTVAGRHAALRELMLTYRPDLMVITDDTGTGRAARTACSLWTRGTLLDSLSLVVLSPPSGRYRGWAVLGGPAVTGGRPVGLTTGSLLTTVELMLDLEWRGRLPDHPPALSVLSLGTAGSLEGEGAE